MVEMSQKTIYNTGMDKNLNKYSIHFLRIVARKMNIKSPTTLKKSELISKICEAKNIDTIRKFVRKPKLFFEDIPNVGLEDIVLELSKLKETIDIYLMKLNNLK